MTALGTSTITSSTVIPANFENTFSTVAGKLKTDIDALYPSTVNVLSTQKDFLNGNITLGSGIDYIFAYTTITPPNDSGNFTITVCGQIVIAGTVTSGGANLVPNLAAIAAASSTLFPLTSISGQVTLNGAGLDGATVTLTGSGSTTVTTDPNGNYTFTNVVNGSYTLSAAKTGYTMSANQSLTVNGANIIGKNFTAIPVPATLVSIAVTTPNQNVNVGATPQFTATGTYTDNSTKDLTSTTTWSSTNTSVATIATGGKATVIGAGSTTISAISGAITGTTTLTTTSGLITIYW